MPKQQTMDANGYSQILVDIQGLKAVREQLERDVMDLHNKRAAVIGMLGDAQKQLKEFMTGMRREMDLARQQKAPFFAELEQTIRRKGSHLELWEKQLDRREMSTRVVEEKLAEIVKQEKAVREKSLMVERTRIKLELEYQKADNARNQVESQLGSINRSRQEVEESWKLVKIRQDKVVNLEGQVEKRRRAVEIREQTVNDTMVEITPKLDQLDAKEKVLAEKELDLKNYESSQREWEERLRELEKVLETKQRKIHEEKLQVSQETMLLRQRQLELSAREARIEQPQPAPVQEVRKPGRPRKYPSAE